MYLHFRCPVIDRHTSVITNSWSRDGWMDERCFRPLLCTVKAELGRGQPGLMRSWSRDISLCTGDHFTELMGAYEFVITEVNFIDHLLPAD